MSEKITIEAECGDCGGTGIYQGFMERTRTAVVCHTCKGTGKRTVILTKFSGRKTVDDVDTIHATQSISGGMPYGEWLRTGVFPAGSEDREGKCPLWWGQSVGNKTFVCKQHTGYVNIFSACPAFGDREMCWRQHDEVNT